MIEINLLPEELRVKGKKEKSGPPEAQRYLIYIIPAALAILVCAHLYLAAVNIKNTVQLRSLNNRWQKLEPQRKQLELFRKEYALLSEEAASMQKLLQSRMRWAEKLNKLSTGLPSGIWFSEISASTAEFSLQGSVVSLNKEEMNLIKKFLDNLKNDADFFADFKALELSSTQSRTLGSYEIMDFALTGALRVK